MADGTRVRMCPPKAFHTGVVVEGGVTFPQFVTPGQMKWTPVAVPVGLPGNKEAPLGIFPAGLLCSQGREFLSPFALSLLPTP